MKKKAQILIITLWILIILAVLAVSIGYRVSLALRLGTYQIKNLESLYLAKSGVNQAIAEINRDLTRNDSFSDSWAENEEAFKMISFGQDSSEFASVSYTDSNGDQIFGVQDEERKININTAEEGLLAALLEKGGITAQESGEIASNIRAWRSNSEIVPAESRDYTDLGYECKGKPFTNCAELVLVKGISLELYRAIEGILTVFGNGDVNINTAEPAVLEVIIASAMNQAAISDQAKLEGLLSAVLRYREVNGQFSEGDLDNLLSVLDLPPADYELITVELRKNLVVESDFFRIIAKGSLDAGKPARQIECVYDSQTRELIFWHES